MANTVKLNFKKPLPTSGGAKPAKSAKASNANGPVSYGTDVTLTTKQHEALLAHCRTRLDWSAQTRDRKVERYTAIDKELAGYIKLNKEDAKRKTDTEQGFGPKPYPVFLQLTKTQLDEAMTYMMSVFFPEEGPYAATAPAEMQDVAKAFTALMNRQASQFNHYGSFAKFVFDGLRYNVGFCGVEWTQRYGTAVGNTDDKLAPRLVENSLMYEGNELIYLDPYNLLVDPSVAPMDLSTSGEFFASVEMKSAFSLRRRLANNELHGIDREYIGSANKASITYYKAKPIILAKTVGETDGVVTDWVTLLAGSTNSATKETIGSLELVKMRILLDGSEFGLTKTNSYTIWELEILNMERIVSIKLLANAHGLLPIFAVRPWDDNFGDQTSSFAEMLLPYQRFSSFQLNVHQHAARKALYGLLFYNSRIFGDLKDVDTAGGKIPTKSTIELDVDLNKHLRQIFDAPDTSNTLRDLEAMDTLMQKILPTDILKQVTDLERATEYQSAATVQGANRRNLKVAQTIDAQAFDKIRQVQMYNILEMQTAMQFLDSKTGQMVDVQPSQFRESKIEFLLGTGLRGLDKLMIMGLVKDVLSLLVQNAQAASTFDVAAIINYLTTLAGDTTNFAQFKFQNEFDKLTPEQKALAFQLLQQAMQAQAQQQGAPDANRIQQPAA